MVDIRGRQHLIFDEHCWRHRLFRKDLKSQRNQPLAISFREKSHGSEQPGALTTQLGPAFRRTAVAERDAFFGAASLFERAQRADRARIVDAADDRPFHAYRAPQMLASRFKA